MAHQWRSCSLSHFHSSYCTAYSWPTRQTTPQVPIGGRDRGLLRTVSIIDRVEKNIETTESPQDRKVLTKVKEIWSSDHYLNYSYCIVILLTKMSFSFSALFCIDNHLKKKKRKTKKVEYETECVVEIHWFAICHCLLWWWPMRGDAVKINVLLDGLLNLDQ